MEAHKESARKAVIDVANTPGRLKSKSHATEWGGKDLSLADLRQIGVENPQKAKMNYAERSKLDNESLKKLGGAFNIQPGELGDEEEIMDSFDDEDYEEQVDEFGDLIYVPRKRVKGKLGQSSEPPKDTSSFEAKILKQMEQATAAAETSANAALLREKNESRRLDLLEAKQK